MPTITDNPPSYVKEDLAQLREQLDKLPSKAVDQNLIIATWNIRCFGDLTEKWESDENDSPKRDLQSLLCIAEIVKRFDVIAIQEVRSNIKALRHLLKVLGPEWSLLMTDETKGYRGNGERLVFIFDTRKVTLSGLACELVIPDDPRDPRKYKLKEQFARTPYAVGFKSANKTFILVTLHAYYGKATERREAELKEIARWLKEWALDENSWDHSIIALGDFNIDRKGDKLYEAFTSTGLSSPPEMDKIPRSIYSVAGQADKEKFYDQMAWFKDIDGSDALSIKYKQCGGFDFQGKVLTNRNLTKNQLSWRISDHLVLFAEFDVRELPEG